MTKPIPEGFRSVNVSLVFKDSQKALDFYQKAFGAKNIQVFPNPAGKGIMHATMQIGDTILMMGDEMPGSKSVETMGGSPGCFFLYTENADAMFDRAVQAGAKAEMPVTDMFWGDRMGSVADPFGYHWSIGTHVKDLTDEEVRKGAEAFFAKAAQK